MSDVVSLTAVLRVVALGVRGTFLERWSMNWKGLWGRAALVSFRVLYNLVTTGLSRTPMGTLGSKCKSTSKGRGIRGLSRFEVTYD